jgi:hypothetical protein
MFVFFFLGPYTEYQLRVRAETGGGYSDYSDFYPALTDVDSKLIHYPPPMESGGGYSFGIVRPSEFRFRSSSLQQLAGIQRNFMGIINIKR